MSMTNASQDTSANPTKDRPTCPERDAQEGTHDDNSTVTQNNPPNHSNAAQKGSPAKFLQWVHPETPLKEDTISRKWDYWYPRDMDTERQPRDDTEPTWGENWGDDE